MQRAAAANSGNILWRKCVSGVDDSAAGGDGGGGGVSGRGRPNDKAKNTHIH